MRLFKEIPNEIILNILKNLNSIDLLNLCLIKLDERIKNLINKVLIEKLSTVRLRVSITQEHNWQYTVDFQLKKGSNDSSRLEFIPVAMNTDIIRLYNSKFLRKPLLMKATLLLDDNKYLKNNLFKSSLSFPIKDVGMQQVCDQQQKTVFKYHVTKTPKHVIKVRPGERFIEPVGFECPIEFLSQPKTILQKLSNYLNTNHKAQLVEMSQFYNKQHYQGASTTAAARPMVPSSNNNPNNQAVPLLYTNY